MLNRVILDDLVEIFEITTYDWFGYPITSENILTLHHIKDREAGGKTSIDNGAPLTLEAHRKINVLKDFLPEYYQIINEMLQVINNSRLPLDYETAVYLGLELERYLSLKPSQAATSLAKRTTNPPDNQVLEELISIFGNPKADWMGYPVTANNRLVYRHIIEPSNGGEKTIDNGALLTRKGNDLLTRVKSCDDALYEEYLYWFRIINDSKKPPSREVITIMAALKKRLNGTFTLKGQKQRNKQDQRREQRLLKELALGTE